MYVSIYILRYRHIYIYIETWDPFRGRNDTALLNESMSEFALLIIYILNSLKGGYMGDYVG